MATAEDSGAAAQQAFYENFLIDVMEGGVDNDFCSRVIAVYGREALKHIQSTKVIIHDVRLPSPAVQVLIVGLNGVGAEVAKNVILTGAHEVSRVPLRASPYAQLPMQVMLHDAQAASPSDLSSQFYLNKEDLGANRAGACLDRLKELNP